MAEYSKPFWTSDRVSGPAGRFRVVVSRVPASHSSDRRDQYAATLFRTGEDGDEAVEIEFWQNSSPPHDADKIAFRERARRAAAAGQ